MYKIRKITFLDHPVLKNLSLDFCDLEGKAVDTIIFAGENGVGKSTILNAIYELINYEAYYEADIEYEKNEEVINISYRYHTLPDGRKFIYVNDGRGFDAFQSPSNVKSKYPTLGIYSDVDINFHSSRLSSVTSLNLDESKDSRRSSSNLSNQINQLLIDIQASDDGDVANFVRKNPNIKYSECDISQRIERFTNAFNNMFEGLVYSRVINKEGKKSILFCKNGIDIPIENLSSGEKQIVYRGCFLLKDVNAMKGAFVFIDEPEISLHPKWQMKIMNYYKNIFKDASGKQTSQLFVVTHSPFIIHNENRNNDKVIVLTKDISENIVVMDKPEYFKCISSEAVEDAFAIKNFSSEQPTVYLEGRTDEKYFNKAVEVFGLQIPFRFKWIGYMKDERTEENTGKDALNKAVHFLIAQNLSTVNVCLFDCDTKRVPDKKGNVYIRCVQNFENTKGMKKGIENALVLDDIDLTEFYSCVEKNGDYGEVNKISTLEKMKLCDHICSLDNGVLNRVFYNLKREIELLVPLFQQH